KSSAAATASASASNSASTAAIRRALSSMAAVAATTSCACPASEAARSSASERMACNGLLIRCRSAEPIRSIRRRTRDGAECGAGGAAAVRERVVEFTYATLRCRKLGTRPFGGPRAGVQESGHQAAGQTAQPFDRLLLAGQDAVGLGLDQADQTGDRRAERAVDGDRPSAAGR